MYKKKIRLQVSIQKLKVNVSSKICKLIDYIWQDNAKQAEMHYSHSGPSRQEKC